MKQNAYHVLLDRIPAAFREAARRLSDAMLDHVAEHGFDFAPASPDLQRAGEDWHAALAAARAWSALQAAKTVHRQTTLRPAHAALAVGQFADEPGGARVLNVGTFFSLPFDRALDAFYQRNADVLIDIGDLWELYWERGATVAEATAAEMRAQLLRSLGAALEAGTPMREWKARMAGEHGGRESYYETVYRTNVAQAYSDGQRAQASAYPDVIGFRRLTTRDRTTRPNHRAAHGHIWRKEDPRADWYSVPWGFQLQMHRPARNSRDGAAAGGRVRC